MPPSTDSQVCNQQHVKDKQHPAYDTCPAEDDVQQKQRTEHQRALPRMKANVVRLVLKQQQYHSTCGWEHEICKTGFELERDAKRRLEQ
jgi:hypothetical protein